ncbi:MAG TPA: hypothetical protein VL201_05390 [Patescibacteria group bacterium]|jgi:DNA polymerase-3 subunit delta'|nr:hypothetical protein [Patescibacteria group bacterium]
MPKQSITIPSAQLYLGSLEETLKKISRYLQSIFCHTHGCLTCAICTQINEKRHAFCLWFSTKKQYLIDDLKPLQEKLQFILGEHEHCFFIIESAELLSPLSANALLKSLEEPPRGYHFILLAKDLANILPTIVSRCVIFYVYDTVTPTVHFKSLYNHFTHKPMAPVLFLSELERTKISEDQSEELLKQLIEFWQKEYRSILLTSKEKNATAASIKKKLDHLYNAIDFLPKSGNAKLFWKQLLLQFNQSVR